MTQTILNTVFFIFQLFQDELCFSKILHSKIVKSVYKIFSKILYTDFTRNNIQSLKFKKNMCQLMLV